MPFGRIFPDTRELLALEEVRPVTVIAAMKESEEAILLGPILRPRKMALFVLRIRPN
jgi:hypothetical protein